MANEIIKEANSISNIVALKEVKFEDDNRSIRFYVSFLFDVPILMEFKENNILQYRYMIFHESKRYSMYQFHNMIARYFNNERYDVSLAISKRKSIYMHLRENNIEMHIVDNQESHDIEDWPFPEEIPDPISLEEPVILESPDYAIKNYSIKNLPPAYEEWLVKYRKEKDEEQNKYESE